MDVTEILYHESDDERVKMLVAKYRKQVLGDSCFKSAPSEYHEINLICELKMSPETWENLSLEHKAKIMAVHYLKNMVDTIDAHYKAQKENRKKNAEGTSSDSDE